MCQEIRQQEIIQWFFFSITYPENAVNPAYIFSKFLYEIISDIFEKATPEKIPGVLPRNPRVTALYSGIPS